MIPGLGWGFSSSENQAARKKIYICVAGYGSWGLVLSLEPSLDTLALGIPDQIGSSVFSLLFLRRADPSSDTQKPKGNLP